MATKESLQLIDQVPLPFVIDQDKTYDLTGNTQVWVSQPSTSLDKRQATLQLCIRTERDLFLRACLRGQRGKHVMGFKDSNTWHREIDCRESDPFADNVGFQQNKDFHETCRRELNAVIYLLPESHTDKVQPIDAGCGKLLKTRIREAMERWLEEDDMIR